MNVVILFGSPRKHGNTIQLVNILSDSMQNKGHHVRMLYLNDMNIRPCQSCLACMKKGICKINDDMKDIRKYILESDLIVFATPVYWFTVSAQLKLAMDRSFAFLDKNFNSRIKGKKAITIMTCASEDASVCQPAIETFKKTFDLLGLSYVGHIEGLGCQEKGNIKKEFKDKTKELAASLV